VEEGEGREKRATVVEGRAVGREARMRMEGVRVGKRISQGRRT
jgi:hypothetical protein